MNKFTLQTTNRRTFEVKPHRYHSRRLPIRSGRLPLEKPNCAAGRPSLTSPNYVLRRASVGPRYKRLSQRVSVFIEGRRDRRGDSGRATVQAPEATNLWGGPFTGYIVLPELCRHRT